MSHFVFTHVVPYEWTFIQPIDQVKAVYKVDSHLGLLLLHVCTAHSTHDNSDE